MPTIKPTVVKRYLVNVNSDIPDWELTFDNQNHVLRGSDLIDILTKSIREMYLEVPSLKQDEWVLLGLGGKIISKIGQLAD